MVLMPSRNVSTLVKGWRDRAGLSQSQAARELDVSLKTLQGWEQGRPTRYARLIEMAIEHACEPRQQRGCATGRAC